ncbi:MAG: Ig-like domain-containing protein, partial [Mariprofundaceae bacterium]|nr:Ig-like domain-containing protein [Mariprofundaceae bacterium]
VTLTVTDINTANDTVNISAVAGGISTATPLTLSFVGTGTGGAGGGANAGNAIALVASANNLPADNYTVATITATVTNAAGAAVANLPLTLSNTGSATLSLAKVTTNAQGTAIFTVRDTVGETVAITVGDGTSTSVLNQTFIPAVATLTVVSNATTVLADGTATATLTIAAKDAQGRGVTGENLAISSDSYTAFLPNTAVTDMIGGQATIQVSNIKAEPVTITVKSRNGGIQAGTVQQGIVKVTFVTPTVRMLVTTFSPALSGSTKDVYVDVTDPAGNPVSGRALTLSSSGSGRLSLLKGTTTAGRLALTLTDSVAELLTITVTDDISGASTTGALQFVSSTAQNIRVTTDKTSAIPDGVDFVTMTAQVTDRRGIAVSNASVDFYTLLGSSVLSLSNVLTDATGRATVTV